MLPFMLGSLMTLIKKTEHRKGLPLSYIGSVSDSTADPRG